jgi:hypothetical protein
VVINWQARRDSNPQHPDLESGALAVRATGLHPCAFSRNPIWFLYEAYDSCRKGNIS